MGGDCIPPVNPMLSQDVPWRARWCISKDLTSMKRMEDAKVTSMVSLMVLVSTRPIGMFRTLRSKSCTYTYNDKRFGFHYFLKGWKGRHTRETTGW